MALRVDWAYVDLEVSCGQDNNKMYTLGLSTRIK